MSMFGAVDLSSLAPRPTASPEPGASAAAQAPSSDQAGGIPAPLIVDIDAQTLGDIVAISSQVPVVIICHSPRSEAAAQAVTMLGRLAEEYAGRFELARLDVDAAPEAAQALGVQAIPACVALLAGQPVPLAQGAAGEEQTRALLDQLLQVAAANGVTGRLAPGASAEDDPEGPVETEVERQAREAIEKGDWASAEAVYDHAIANSPADADLKTARAQIRMLARMDGQDPAALLAAADAAPEDLDAALAGADAALAVGDAEDCLARALDAVARHGGDERETARLRLLELFEIIGASAPEVQVARRRLATILY
ncbi:tetratricopeptide repeat protein [Actinomyces gaoshouyii]|uniref:Co-chaperone YbbN n=1 Tax=Actinomyces gaoshouyii TaxID=1960083 RepID=A0A8H9HC44_9ACTO|nr:tetratricopeptide repeat protein [Actinomyces gaoshouyii]GGO96940.1 co-chaperone YbbN [Actinomyces gaoshouyii]